MNYGQLFRELRKRVGVTQLAVGKALGTHNQYVYGVEMGIKRPLSPSRTMKFIELIGHPEGSEQLLVMSGVAESHVKIPIEDCSREFLERLFLVCCRGEMTEDMAAKLMVTIQSSDA